MGMAVHRSRDAQRGAVLDGTAKQVEQRVVDRRVPDAGRGEKKPTHPPRLPVVERPDGD